MTLSPGLRKFALTVHMIALIGWNGIVAGFLALALAGRVSSDPDLVRASYLAMDFAYRSVVIPLGLASLMRRVVSSLGTDWGLCRHYWIVVKLLLTLPAVFLMLVHIRPVGYAASAALGMKLPAADLPGLRIQLVIYALILLLAATALSRYKPRGRIRRSKRD